MTNLSMNNEPVKFQKCVEIQVTSGFTSNYLSWTVFCTFCKSLPHHSPKKKWTLPGLVSALPI